MDEQKEEETSEAPAKQEQQGQSGIGPDVGQAIIQRINLLVDMISNMGKPEECKKEEKVWE